MSQSATIIPANMGEKSRVVIPAEVKKVLGLSDKGPLQFCIRGNEVHITTRYSRLRRAQEEIRKLIPADVSLADELIAERREAAKHE
jgi:bifunctional DNA-binding transcriptional regulator/antitoxin component of YhaV-PrlF toxin-antitoxin module